MHSTPDVRITPFRNAVPDNAERPRYNDSNLMENQTNPVPAERQILHTGKFLALIKEGRWEYASRVNATGASIIIAVTDERKLLLVEQYRIPVHARTVELPAGMIGDEPGDSDETNAHAARRELLEETGYDAEQITALTTGPASGGATSEVVTLFWATKLRRVGAGGGVAHEDITVHEIPLAEIHDWLETKARTGVLIDPKVYAGLYFAQRLLTSTSSGTAKAS